VPLHHWNHSVSVLLFPTFVECRYTIGNFVFYSRTLFPTIYLVLVCLFTYSLSNDFFGFCLLIPISLVIVTLVPSIITMWNIDPLLVDRSLDVSPFPTLTVENLSCHYAVVSRSQLLALWLLFLFPRHKSNCSGSRRLASELLSNTSCDGHVRLFLDYAFDTRSRLQAG